jgi:xylan 1,4-beta-xylosidase
MSKSIFQGQWADPYVLRAQDGFYCYPTCDTPSWGGERFFAFHSPDLQSWSGPFEVLDLNEVEWASSLPWAPCVGFYNQRYWMYFCADQQIGVASSHSPLGPFKDVLGKPLIARDEYGCQSIDPDLFLDSDGQPYLLWGQGKCFIAPLSSDMKSFRDEPVCLSDQLYQQAGRDPEKVDISFFNEGPHLQKIGQRYLLSWTNYDFRDPRYQVRYAWSDSVLGPYRAPENNVLLEPANDVWGTGHASMVCHEGRWFLFYHRMGKEKLGTGDREICMGEIVFENGSPLKIIPGS